jgi:hypothetical protein
MHLCKYFLDDISDYVELYSVLKLLLLGQQIYLVYFFN